MQLLGLDEASPEAQRAGLEVQQLMRPVDEAVPTTEGSEQGSVSHQRGTEWNFQKMKREKERK